MTNTTNAKALVREYGQIVDDTHGACLDFGAARISYLAQLNTMNVTRVPGARVHFVNEDPNVLEREGRWASGMAHSVLATELIARNQPGAANETLSGNMCLVYIYQMWEDEYRERIAQELGYTTKNELKVPVMGDIRQYRMSIVHNKGIAITACDNCQVLKWFTARSRISITADMLWHAKLEITKALSALTGL